MTNRSGSIAGASALALAGCMSGNAAPATVSHGGETEQARKDATTGYEVAEASVPVPLTVSHGGETEQARKNTAGYDLDDEYVEEKVTEPVPATQRGAKLAPR